MCGIAGFSLSTTERCHPTDVARAMLLAIELRGPHATGVAWCDPHDGRVWIHKDAMAAHDFVKHMHLAGGRTAILHTRFATKGTPQDNGNNHPIDVGGIVGVHNGQIRNDDELFAALDVERYAEVDSEAAFALLHATQELPQDVLGQLKGTAALAWMQVDPDGCNPSRTLHLARLSYSPLWLAQTRNGSTLFGSTLRAVRLGAEAMGADLAFRHEVKEGTYLKVRLGVVGHWLPVPGVVSMDVGKSRLPLLPRERIVPDIVWDDDELGDDDEWLRDELGDDFATDDFLSDWRKRP